MSATEAGPVFPEARPISTGAGVFDDDHPPADLMKLDADPEEMPALVRIFAVVDQNAPETSGVVLVDENGGAIRTDLRYLYSAFQSLFHFNSVITERLPEAQHDQKRRELAQILLHLNRCEHGRNEGDACAGWSTETPTAGCRGGRSLGNPYVGVRIGVDTYGRELFLAPIHQHNDPEAWRRWPSRPPEHVRDLTDDEVTRAHGDASIALVGRMIGMRWYQRGRLVLGYSSGDDSRLMSVVPVDGNGDNIGPTVTIVHELTDEEIAARDAGRGGGES